jgi:polyhydroxyalkanoate synthase
MYLGNDLALGRYSLDGQLVSLHDISVPVFVVGTVKDHVSPWRSVFKIHRLVDTDVTFVLTNGGHNAGIVSEPGHAGRHYQIHTTAHGQHRPHPDDWAHSAPRREGSWWEAWSGWLQTHSAAEPVAAQPLTETAWGAAPGQYVMLRHGD